MVNNLLIITLYVLEPYMKIYIRFFYYINYLYINNLLDEFNN